MDDALWAAAHRECDLASESLRDARLLIDGDGSVTGVLDRLYYAAFHGAQAVLYARGVNPSSHGQVRQQFGQQVVLEGNATRDDGRLLGRLYDYRQAAEYSGRSPDVDLPGLCDEVQAFVERMRPLVDEHDRDP